MLRKLVIPLLIVVFLFAESFCQEITPSDLHKVDTKQKHNDEDVTLTEKIISLLSNDEIYVTVILSVIFFQALVLVAMGQPIISRSGKVKLWEGDINSTENSQQLTDWYTFSHMLHGFIFYGMSYLIVQFLPHLNIGLRGAYVVAILVEVFWEVLENSSFIIERYRKTTLAIGYSGDSILNSVSDTVSMSIGFWIAFYIPPLAAIGLAIMEEILLALIIRDNLTLNVIQLIYPLQCISNWQSGGAPATKPAKDKPLSEEENKSK